MWDWVYTLGRILLPILFVAEGVGQFANIRVFADMLERSNMPLQLYLEMLGANRFIMLGYLVAAIEVVCGLMIMLGFRTRIAALLLVLFTIATIFVGHPFWQMEGNLRAIALTHALKNLSIIAGLLVLVAHGSGVFALDNRSRRH